MSDIAFAQMDDARATPRRFADEASLRQMLIASRMEPCATPNFDAHFPSTMRIPGFNDPLKISLRSSSARLFLLGRRPQAQRL